MQNINIFITKRIRQVRCINYVNFKILGHFFQSRELFELAHLKSATINFSIKEFFEV